MKKMNNLVSLMIIMVLVVASTSIFAAEGFYFKQVAKTPEMMGQPGSEEITEQYILGDKVRMVNGDEITILTNKNMIAISHSEKAYSITDLAVFAQMAGMIDMQFANFNVTKTGKTEKVGKWDTDVYKASLSMMGQTMEMVFNVHYCILTEICIHFDISESELIIDHYNSHY